jgi:hypothetical protein
MPELGHILAVGIALLATAIFAAMAWASRPAPSTVLVAFTSM